jgi:hypothetical protein
VQCLDADIDPAAIPRLLPFTFMCTVLPDGIFTIRLAGEELLRFVEKNPIDQAAGSPPPVAPIWEFADGCVA